MKDTEQTKKSGTLEFTAEIYAAQGGFVCLDLPKETIVNLGSKKRMPVIGNLNGYPIRISVFPTGEDAHFMLVNKKMQRGAGVNVGDRVNVILQIDTAPRKVEVPDDLRGALAQAKEAKEAFERLSYTHQKECVSWIEEAKRPETRERRIRNTLTRLIEEQHNKGSR